MWIYHLKVLKIVLDEHIADNQTPVIGTRFTVSNGQLITDSNGKISVDIDSGVVSINC